MSPHLASGFSGAFESSSLGLILLETLRIAIITETLPPDRLNLQPWRYLGDLAQSLQLAGHETFILTRADGASAWNGVPILAHPNREDFHSAPALRKVLQSHHFDVGVCRLTAGLFFSMHERPQGARSAERLVGIFLRPLHNGPDLAMRFLDPLLAPEISMDLHHAALYASRLLGTWPGAPPWVDDFVFLWNSDQQRAVNAGLPARSCRVVRHPFDPFFRERGSSVLGPRLSGFSPPVGRRIVFSGPPEEIRGVSDVVRLARFLPSEPPTQVLLLLRDPAFREPTVTRAQIGRHEVLSIHGLLSREEIRAIYRQSDVAVFPYRFVRTALPLVLLEAAAAGLPVVTTRVHPIRELEGRSGLVFAHPRDPRDLARAVLSVFDLERKQEIRRKDEAWVRSTPDWSEVAEAFVTIVRGSSPIEAGEGS